jgi:FkbM family methyltransferase
VDDTFKHIKVSSEEQRSKTISATEHPVIQHMLPPFDLARLRNIELDDPSQSPPFKYFLDFGTHLGEGLEKIRNYEKLKEEVEIYSFEANPYTFQQIQFEDDVEYYNIAVSAQDGFFNFNCEIQDDGQPHGGGSSLIDITHWNNEETYNWKENERFTRYKPVGVFSMSITSLLYQLLPNRSEKSILAKFDIEGKEFDVFEQLRATDNFKWFSKIYIEFHQENIDGKRPPTTDFEWMQYFEDTGLDIVLWN